MRELASGSHCLDFRMIRSNYIAWVVIIDLVTLILT